MSTTPVPSVQPPALVPNRLFQTRIANEAGYMTEPVWVKFINTLPKAGQQVTFIPGTHSARLGISAASYPSGTIYQETDRGIFYAAVRGVWTYAYGVLYTPQDGLPTDLGTADMGLLVGVTDFNHLLRWNGTGWEWGPGDSGSDCIQIFLAGPNAATAGWQPCDGTALNIPVLQPDGSVTTLDVPDFSAFTLPGTAGFWYRQ
jgi:hypothetical protein